MEGIQVFKIMAITKTETLIPKAHSKLIVFRDHFGHEHKVVVPTHIATEDPLKPFPVGPAHIEEFDAQLGNIEKMMRDRELAFLQHCLDHGHGQHPLVLSHPDHPSRKPSTDMNALDKAMKSKDCKDCG